MSDFLAIITVQLASERLPNKALAPVAGKPLLQWLIERVSHPLTGLGARVVVATPAAPVNDPVQALCEELKVPCYRRASDRDVVGEMDAIVQELGPKFLMRVLGDSPFLATEVPRRAVHCLRRFPDRDLFLYFLPAWCFPIYGSREFPVTRRAWDWIARNARGEEREHVDLWPNRHRDQFNILYHEGPSNWYYAHPDRIRLEVDWEEDLEMVRAVAEQGPGMLAPLIGRDGILPWLQANEWACKNAKLRREKTGPTMSYTDKDHKQWFRLMQKADFVLTWENEQLRPPPGRAVQKFCDSGQCLLGWGVDGVLKTPNGGTILHAPRLGCACGAGGSWKRKIGG